MEIAIMNNSSWLKYSLYEEEDEGLVYDEQLKDVLKNTRWYLDNIDYISEYRVSWNDYKSKSATTPLKLLNGRNKSKPL